jgi:flagellar motor component MotA
MGLPAKGCNCWSTVPSPSGLREVMDVEITTYEQELRSWRARIWEAAGGYSPTIGILGAVLGLIHVMENLSDPSKLGAGIAVAFVATIYGVGLANLVFLPVANRLKAHISRLVVQREMIVDGLVGIANGDNPRIIESRLQAPTSSDAMARRRQYEEEHDNHERWLVSYADFITLLFAFFVVMYALSSVNEGKYRVLSNSMVVARSAMLR